MKPILSVRRGTGSRLRFEPLASVAEEDPYHKVTGAASQPARNGRIEAGSDAWCHSAVHAMVEPLAGRSIVPPGLNDAQGDVMRLMSLTGVALAGLWSATVVAEAQQNPAMQNPSVVEPKSPAPSGATTSGNVPLSPGANSFIEGQARALLEARGFTQVSRLMNDSQGIWRGTAMSGTSRVRVSVDYKGHVSAQPE